MSKPEREPNGIPTSAAATPATPQKHPPADEGVQAMAIDADQLPDEVLLAGLGTGDVRFMAAFVRRFQRLVFGVAKTITGDLATAEDITRRAFEQAFDQARMYGPIGGQFGRG
jgi:RNA polymerase sigma-70 factor (ECF subfamily)